MERILRNMLHERQIFPWAYFSNICLQIPSFCSCLEECCNAVWLLSSRMNVLFTIRNQQIPLILPLTVCHFVSVCEFWGHSLGLFSSFFFTAAFLTYHSRKSTGVTNNTNDGSVLFRCFKKPWQWSSMFSTRTLKLKQVNGIQPSLFLLFTPVLFWKRPFVFCSSILWKLSCIL